MRQKLAALLAALTLLAAAAIPARAAEPTAVRVNGAVLDAPAYLADGVTWAPLRSLCESLGGWTVVWDAEAGCAAASGAAGVLTAVPGETAVRLNDEPVALPGPVYLRNGRTYVPLRAVCEALGLRVAWNAALSCAAVETADGGAAAAEEDLYWLSRIISAESRGEPFTGQVAVGNVVLNRAASGEFPNTIREVVFDRRHGVQFEPVANGTVYDPPTASAMAAARAALAGERPVGRCLYFFAPALSAGTWIRQNRTYSSTIGCHRFYL
jgi:N-acetylmuramoyl-L-alanine amidase